MRALVLFILCLWALACARSPSGGTLSGDVYEIRLAMENFQTRQESFAAEMRAFRASQDRQIEALATRVAELQGQLNEIQDALDELAEPTPQPEPVVRHELRLNPDPENQLTPTPTPPPTVRPESTTIFPRRSDTQ